MKRFIFLAVILSTLFVSACHNNTDMGIIGGADGPTNLIVHNQNDKIISEKEPIRMVKINGTLYYETGEKSEVEARCGTLDGSFQKAADRFEIPQNQNESNFSGSKGWQTGAAENQIEIQISDDWKIFKKLDTNAEVLSYQYSYILGGTLPNAMDKSRFLVLANSMDVTFEEAAYKMFGADTTKMKDIYVLPIVD